LLKFVEDHGNCKNLPDDLEEDEEFMYGEQNRSVQPDAFTYCCCDGNANSKGCKNGRHWAAGAESLRRFQTLRKALGATMRGRMKRAKRKMRSTKLFSWFSWFYLRETSVRYKGCEGGPSMLVPGWISDQDHSGRRKAHAPSNASRPRLSHPLMITTKIQAIINAPRSIFRLSSRLPGTGDERTLQRIWLALSRIQKFEKQTSESNNRMADAAVGSEPAEPLKRVNLIEDVHHCVRCDKPFVRSKNHKKACWYHPCESPPVCPSPRLYM
jgi:hypothetical protein